MEARNEKEEMVADGNGGHGRDATRIAAKTMVVVMVVVVEDERRFREPRSTFNHLRSITSAEVMAASRVEAV